MHITVNYTESFEEIRKRHKFLWKEGTTKTTVVVVLNFVLGLMCIAWEFHSVEGGWSLERVPEKDSYTPFSSFSLGGALIIAAIYLLYFFIIAKRMAKKQLRDHYAAINSGMIEQTLEITDETVMYKEPGITKVVRWNMFNYYWFQDDEYQLYIRENHLPSVTISKKHFQPADFEEISAFIKKDAAEEMRICFYSTLK